MEFNINIRIVTILRIAVGIIALVLVLAGGAGATRFINNNTTGGECTSFGTWNAAAKTCNMTSDLTEGIQIDSDGITINGNGHSLTGSNTGYGIYLESRTGVNIKNLNVKKFYNGISMLYSKNITLSGNIVSNNGWGIRQEYSHYNTIINNNIFKNGGGISLPESGDTKLINNNVYSNNGTGISIGDFSNDNILIGNNVSSNNGNGISIVEAHYNKLAGNNISNNRGTGIRMGAYTAANTLVGNNVSNNNLGISTGWESGGSAIYNNIFNNINNFDLYDSLSYPTIDIWNTTRQPGTNIIGGPSIGGNFWGYPNGTGFSQKCRDDNRDGICDAVYVLNDYNTDYLPLAKYTAIRVISPNGGEIWPRGTMKTIRWTYTGTPGPRVRIELLKNGTFNRMINSSTPTGSGGSGSYRWLINASQAPGTNYKVRVTSTTNAAYTDTSNNNFNISGP